ncbi:MAG: hypothetical protein M1829_006570 [Trizodia sp. TS-e1964]|nr:MAG: hypothetical protein M1829_006570 [Trizodia sp. TS-e1964]
MPKDMWLLALDGGGVRRLSAVMILHQLMEAVNLDAPPKPCDYFDMISGTSTGGKKRHTVTVVGKIQGRFDSDEPEQAVKEVIKAQGVPEGALLKDDPGTACKVLVSALVRTPCIIRLMMLPRFVCATSKETSETVCLTSYKSPRGNNDLLNSVQIWEACRATSAASSFFDPIAIGRYNEEFVDGSTGANNPLICGLDPLEGRVQCLVSIGTGIPSLKLFRDNLFHISETLVAIATETEQTAERFQRAKAYLNSSNRYSRFNVERGLENIGLEESTKRKEIAAATRRYVASQDVFKQMQTCAVNLASQEYVGEYRTSFSLEGVPRVKTFVERPGEMAELERAILPQRQNIRQKIFVLHGLGGIGKTQLAVKFTRRHRCRFSSVFWLDGSSKVSLKLSIARCASRIPACQISDMSRTYSMGSAGNIDEVVREVICWLAQPDNTEWLVVFDNVDRNYSSHTADPLAYDVREYFFGANHGFVLITTKLAQLEQLGGSQQVNKVDRAQAQEILESWSRKELYPVESGRLFSLLDGLPLAIAQAGAYLQQSGVSLGTYLTFYKQQWKELMQTRDQVDTPLQDGSIWTTWTISFNVIREQDKATSNLLLLWSFLDSKDLWFKMFTAACSASGEAAAEISRWIGDLANKKYNYCNGGALERSRTEGRGVVLDAVHMLGILYADPGKLGEAEKMYTQALQGYEEALGPKHISTLRTVNNLGVLYKNQGKLGEAEKMYIWALQGYEEALGENFERYIPALNTMWHLGNLFQVQGELIQAKQMFKRALAGFKAVLGASGAQSQHLECALASLDSQRSKPRTLVRRIKRRIFAKAPVITMQTRVVWERKVKHDRL